MNIRRFLSLAVLVCAAPPAFAQQRDSLLDALTAEALAQNPSIAQRQAASRAATLRIRPAGTLPDPTLTAGVMDLVVPFEFNQSEFTEVDAELSQTIPWPGSLGARSGVAKAAAVGARAEEHVTRREVAAAMADAYYRLQYAVSALASLRRQLTLLEAAVQLSTTRYGTGSAPQSDPLQAKLARDRLQLEALSAESDRVSALAAVNALRNRFAGRRRPGHPSAPRRPARRGRCGRAHDSSRTPGRTARFHIHAALRVQAPRARLQFP